MADVLDEFVSKVREIVGDDAEIMAKIETKEKEIRLRMGGCSPYVSKNVCIELRRERALDALRRGAKVRDISKSIGLGRDEIYKLKKLLSS